MYLHLFLLLFSSGASGYFLPLKETLHLQNKTKYAIIDEMLCLLEAENESINVNNFPLSPPQICFLKLFPICNGFVLFSGAVLHTASHQGKKLLFPLLLFSVRVSIGKLRCNLRSSRSGDI